MTDLVLDVLRKKVQSDYRVPEGFIDRSRSVDITGGELRVRAWLTTMAANRGVVPLAGATPAPASFCRFPAITLTDILILKVTGPFLEAGLQHRAE